VGDGEAGGGSGHLLSDHEVVAKSSTGLRIEPHPGAEGNGRGVVVRLWTPVLALGVSVLSGHVRRRVEARRAPVPWAGAPRGAEHGVHHLGAVRQQPLGAGPHQALEGGYRQVRIFEGAE
jgi:hypothetical protein